MINRLKLSLGLAPLALLLVIGVYIYSLWAAERQKASDIPVEAIGAMMRDLLSFHEKRGVFPETLKQLEGVVWEKRTREFVSGNRALNHRNYYYLYTRVTNHRFTLWAIPMGRFREETSTWFLAGSPFACRRWKGAPIDLDDVSKLAATPSLGQLGLLGLVEQEKITFSDQRTSQIFLRR
ncbi:hypothetical protein [Leptolyngbya sp. 7M]|uniref:hypothetical protein n=1 Tax=Leptolyngbya sp. 7M TaxID=2812896 RepID=UPI001B8C4E20|nr:hypothetical protein [Leptolyngbya sp. 7M]QYO65300.1 hypothetical protein JVX88_00505 [Leptolyngbya sp. 7M]